MPTPTHSTPRPHGTLIVTDVDGREYRRDTLRCCHCQKVWVVQPGSGRVRGFCSKCAAPTCGDAACHDCKPWEKQLEAIEAGIILP
jgi:hypothetical protein